MVPVACVCARSQVDLRDRSILRSGCEDGMLELRSPVGMCMSCSGCQRKTGASSREGVVFKCLVVRRGRREVSVVYGGGQMRLCSCRLAGSPAMSQVRIFLKNRFCFGEKRKTPPSP